MQGEEERVKGKGKALWQGLNNWIKNKLCPPLLLLLILHQRVLQCFGGGAEDLRLSELSSRFTTDFFSVTELLSRGRPNFVEVVHSDIRASLAHIFWKGRQVVFKTEMLSILKSISNLKNALQIFWKTPNYIYICVCVCVYIYIYIHKHIFSQLEVDICAKLKLSVYPVSVCLFSVRISFFLRKRYHWQQFT